MYNRTVQAVEMTTGRNEEHEMMTFACRTVQAVGMTSGRNEQQEVTTVTGRTV
jgi:hypothetical protein